MFGDDDVDVVVVVVVNRSLSRLSDIDRIMERRSVKNFKKSNRNSHTNACIRVGQRRERTRAGEQTSEITKFNNALTSIYKCGICPNCATLQ